MRTTSRTAGWLLAAAFLLSTATPSGAALGDCGQPASDGGETTTLDALYALRASVDLVYCNRCVCDLDDSGTVTASDAQAILRDAVGLEVVVDCPACDPEGLDCPVVAQFALFARIRGACATNAECAGFSVCDTSIGRCRTGTDADVGWTGLAHNSDVNDPVPARVFLDCSGPAPCGECTISGHDPSLRNCRCENDNRQPCFTVAGPDEEFCGGNTCTCNFGPPLPLSSGNIPICVLNTLAGQPGGDVNVDKGSGVIELHLAEKVFLGLSITQPCPLCVNDTTPADGMRNGVCVGGLNDGQTCDAQAYNATFPPPTGALHSLDCFPIPEANITGPGLAINVPLSTGYSEMTADMPCADSGAGAMFDCPCLVCSDDATRGCHSDQECADAGAGTCSSIGGGDQPFPNACATGECESSDGVEGICVEGPDDSYCDQVLRPDGTGLISCGANADCEPGSIGFDGGDCTLVERRPCFLETIVSQGAPHPAIPLASGPFCSAATSNPSVNIVAGLPGPGRLTLQTAVSLYCKNDPTTLYVPGTGGCPAVAN
ncbi:MAG: hypothetical protein ABR538_04760 [Candidatus Binatia bacterium]